MVSTFAWSRIAHRAPRNHGCVVVRNRGFNGEYYVLCCSTRLPLLTVASSGTVGELTGAGRFLRCSRLRLPPPYWAPTAVSTRTRPLLTVMASPTTHAWPHSSCGRRHAHAHTSREALEHRFTFSPFVVIGWLLFLLFFRRGYHVTESVRADDSDPMARGNNSTT
jgi:hypothetical protein